MRENSEGWVQVKVSAVYAFDRPLLFALSQDMEARPQWDAQVKAIGFMAGSCQLEKEAKVWIKDEKGGYIETLYTNYTIPERIAIVQTNRSRFFKAFEGSWTYELLSKNETRLIIQYRFQLRFPFSLFRSLVEKKVAAKLQDKLDQLRTFLNASTIESGYA